MDKMDLKKYGITGVTEIVYNPSYDELFREETKKGLRGYEKGQLTDMGAVNVMTGVYTGRSPKDKFFVMDETTKDTIWWTSDEYKNDNKPVTKAAWKELKKIASKELSGKKLYVVDTFCGANENTRLKIRFIMEVAWQAHFVKNMFIRPTDAELENYGEPDFVVLNASKAKVTNYKKLGLNSETAVVFNLTEKMQVIINTWYGGEMKKGMFSYMNYLLPLKGIASMHCSANTNEKGETAIFFGLSGTGKTTLSTDPKRQLIGDDEHGWDDDGVFNFEGGCYAKAAVSDPKTAELTGLDYVTGTSDALETSVILDMMLTQNPDLKKVGLLYSLSEPNSATPIQEAKEYLDSKGISYVEQTGNTNDEVIAAASALVAGGVDAIFTPTDNVIMSAELAIYEQLAQAKIPHYTGADSFVRNGAFATCGVNYTDLGTRTADLAYQAITEGVDGMEDVYYMDGGLITVNTETAKALGIDPQVFSQLGEVVEVTTTKE